ncbi:MAG: hypothetical protein IPP90_09515 [Gemmatimonadaceae bacterium]|nr:hypothetical protein [Gemmatimonadaceae bacterium]
MPDCVSAANLTISVSGSALLTALVAGMVGHGSLRPLLEARGITPWRLRDSLGSLPLVLIGSGLLGGTAALLAAWGVLLCSIPAGIIMTVSGLMVSGVLMMRLGLLALRKLV